MSLLQSALDFLAGPGSLGGAAGRDQTDFVGQTVELGELRLRVRRVLAEESIANVGVIPFSPLDFPYVLSVAPTGCNIERQWCQQLSSPCSWCWGEALGPLPPSTRLTEGLHLYMKLKIWEVAESMP